MQSSIGSQKRLGRKRFKELGRRRRFRNQCSAAIGCTFLLGWAVIICYLFQRVSEGSKEHHAAAAAADAATIDSGGVPPVHRSSSSNPGDGTVHVDTSLTPQVHGHYAMLGSGPTQMEAVYSIPDKTTPKGIVLIFHACTHNALKFFVPNPTDCPQCIGLSEEIRITQLVNARGYAVLALTSQDRQSGCWSADMPAVRAALTDFQTRVLLAGNVIAIGASSGGNFAAAAAANGIARAALIMVVGLGPVVRGQLVENSTKAAMPLLYLAPMPRDRGTTKKARENYEELAKSNASRIIFDDTTCVSLPVTATYLHQRVPNLSIEAAALIVEALTSSQHLNAETNMFATDPTRSNWRDVLREACEAQGCLDQQSLEPGLSPLAKALHRAWAFHEYCSEVIPKAFDFFEKSQP